MNSNFNDKQRSTVSRKLKYGSLSVGFAVMVVVLCIAVNLAASAFSAKWDLRVDITDDEARYYTISNATKELFDDLFADNPDWHITLRFFTAEDKVSDPLVLELARSYESAFVGHISLAFTDINTNIDLWEKYCSETQTKITEKHVLVEGEYHKRAISFTNFYLYSDGMVYAFTGEKTYTAAIVKAGLKDSPVAVFTAGHGESINNGQILLDTFVGASTEVLEQLDGVHLFNTLYDMGFSIQVLDLNDETAVFPDNTRLIIVSDPQYDFFGYTYDNNAISELDILREQMNKYNCSLMVSVDDETGELPNLSEYLWDEFGIGYVAGKTVTDNTDSLKGSGGTVLLGKLRGDEDAALGTQILQDFTGTERFVFPDSVKLTVSKESWSQGENVLINSSSTAVADGKQSTYPLIAYSLKAESIEDEKGNDTENKKYKTAYLLASTDFLSSDYLLSSYGNKALLESILRKANTVQEYVNIKDIKIVSESLDITTGEARAWTVAVTLIAPAVIFCVAAVVWIRRRHA